MNGTGTNLDIPWKPGLVVVLSDLHYDSYAKSGDAPFSDYGLDRDIPWLELDALIIADDLADAPLLEPRTNQS